MLGDQYLIIVSDNGPGVPDEETQKVFEDFEQLSKGDARDSTGMGLGLPIARRLARAMGGDVWYERRFPTGARFCYSLPLNRRNVLVGDGPEHQLQPDEMVRVEVPDIEASRAV